MFFVTPKPKSAVLILAFIIYATAPIVQWWRLEKMLANGELPVNADSIGLGFFFFLAAWIVFAPMIWAFLVWVWWRQPERVGLFEFNGERPIWSLIWSLAFIVLFFDKFFTAVESLRDFELIDFLQQASLAYLMLLLRALIVFRK